MSTAGEMIQAGDIEGMIHQYERGGRGSAGWSEARDWLEQRHPGSSQRSFDAVEDRARQVVQIGNRYRQGGPDYRPPTGDIPDVRGLERGQPGVTRSSNYIHVFMIRMTPAGEPNAGPVYVRVRHVTQELLTRSEFEAVANTIAQQFNRTFQDTVPSALRPERLAPEIRIEGIYRGF